MRRVAARASAYLQAGGKPAMMLADTVTTDKGHPDVLWKLVEICLLKAGPQDLPAKPGFLGLVLAGYVLVDILISRINFTPGIAVAVSLLDALLLATFVQLVLRIRAKPERFNQTLAAMAGTGLLLGLLAVPVIQGLSAAQLADQAASGLALLWLAILIWSLLILGHILRHALEVKLATGIGIGVLYSLLSVMIVRSLFPDAG